MLAESEDPQILAGSETEMDVTVTGESSEVARRLSLSETPPKTVGPKDTETKMTSNDIELDPIAKVSNMDRGKKKIGENEE